ncbi:hypothetical protein NN561_020276 [Cricetulus griseus]
MRTRLRLVRPSLQCVKLGRATARCVRGARGEDAARAVRGSVEPRGRRGQDGDRVGVRDSSRLCLCGLGAAKGPGKRRGRASFPLLSSRYKMVSSRALGPGSGAWARLVPVARSSGFRPPPEGSTLRPYRVLGWLKSDDRSSNPGTHGVEGKTDSHK